MPTGGTCTIHKDKHYSFQGRAAFSAAFPSGAPNRKKPPLPKPRPPVPPGTITPWQFNDKKAKPAKPWTGGASWSMQEGYVSNWGKQQIIDGFPGATHGKWRSARSEDIFASGVEAAIAATKAIGAPIKGFKLKANKDPGWDAPGSHCPGAHHGRGCARSRPEAYKEQYRMLPLAAYSSDQKKWCASRLLAAVRYCGLWACSACDRGHYMLGLKLKSLDKSPQCRSSFPLADTAVHFIFNTLRGQILEDIMGKCMGKRTCTAKDPEMTPNCIAKQIGARPPTTVSKLGKRPFVKNTVKNPAAGKLKALAAALKAGKAALAAASKKAEADLMAAAKKAGIGTTAAS